MATPLLTARPSGSPTHSVNFENTVYQGDTTAVEPDQVMYILITI